MKYFGGLILVAYTALAALGGDRLPDDERGKVPTGVRTAPGGILMWHSGFMGGK